MNESIHKYFKIGTIQWMSHPPADRDVLTSIHQIACDDFFDAIEVSKFDCDEARAKAKKMLDEGHMTVCYGAQPRLLGPKLNPNDIDEEGRKKAEATLLEAVDEAEYLGARDCVPRGQVVSPRRRSRLTHSFSNHEGRLRLRRHKGHDRQPRSL